MKRLRSAPASDLVGPVALYQPVDWQCSGCLLCCVYMNRRPPSLGSHAGARPRVLLVDDHQPILDTVSATLAGDFDVAGVATSGTQALVVARAVDPDLIVLDITMPGLDGFQT